MKSAANKALVRTFTTLRFVHAATLRSRRTAWSLCCKSTLVTRNVTGYAPSMIRSFKHKGLEKFFLKGIKSGIQAKYANRLKLILGRLNASTSPKDMDLPGLQLHELGGKRKGIWSVWVSGNWRVTFCFKDKDADIVDYEDYH